VGEEVVEEVRKSISYSAKLLHKNINGKYHFNFWEANHQILLACGLEENHIEVIGECTFQQEGKYYSARREGMLTGRIVSGIMLI
jgi:polyphenol oxidase